MEHHPIFSLFKPEVEFISDSFLGTVSRREFTSEAMREKVCARGPAGLPAFNEEYFEWIDLLESIKEWKPGSGPYTFVELGAGYGRWSVRAAIARPLARIIAAEAEPTHFAWMLQNFKDNGVLSDRHYLSQVAVSNKPGVCRFHFGRPAEWYGQCIADPECAPPETGTVEVPCVTIEQLLKYVTFVDLIDMDMQGHEFVVLNSSIETLNAKVKRLHIATHSREIERDLWDLLGSSQNGWELRWNFAGMATHETTFGPIEFQDGVQSWINTRLA